MGRNSCCVKQKLRKGLWSPEEDEKLYNYITRFGVGCWSSVPKLAGLQRCGKSCRLRWINYLRPDLKRGMFSQQEEDLIINLHEALGNRWAQIAAQLPGRTDNEIKNFWNSSLKKKLLKQGIDPNTHKQIDSHIVIKDERERDERESPSSSMQILQQDQMYNLSSMMCNNGGGKIRENFPDKQVYDPIFLSEFQASVDIPDGFQSNFLSHPYERESSTLQKTRALPTEFTANPICGFNSMPNLTNFDHQNLGKFVMNDGKESSSSSLTYNNGGGAYAWDDESKLDSVFQFQFSGIQIEERNNNQKQIISDDFATYNPLNMSVFDHSI